MILGASMLDAPFSSEAKKATCCEFFQLTVSFCANIMQRIWFMKECPAVSQLQGWRWFQTNPRFIDLRP